MIAYIFATEQLRIKVRQIEMTDIPANFKCDKADEFFVKMQ